MIDLDQVNALIQNVALNKESVIVDKTRLELLLEKRVSGGEHIKDFFLVVPSEEEGSTEITLTLNLPFFNKIRSAYYNDFTVINEDREIKMRVFFCRDAPNAALCNHRFMDYPNVSKPEPNKNIDGHTKEVF